MTLQLTVDCTIAASYWDMLIMSIVLNNGNSPATHIKLPLILDGKLNSHFGRSVSVTL